MKRLLLRLLRGGCVVAIAASAAADGLLLTAVPDSSTLPVGATVNVDLEISGVTPPTGLAGFIIDLQYDPAVLALTEIVHGTALGNSLITDDPLADPLFLSEVSLETAAGFFGSQPGTFLLARLTFQGLAQGTSLFTFGVRTSLTDQLGTSLPFGTSAGMVQVSLLPDYAITTTLSAILISDLSGHGDTLTISEPAAGQLAFAAPGRWFSLDGAAPILGTSGGLELAGVTSLTVNAGGGDDTVDVGAFTGALPDLTVDGGAGADAASFLSGSTVTIQDADGFTLNGSAVSALLTLNSDGPVTQTAPITGTGGLQKLGTGTLTLSEHNTHTGDSTVAVGTLVLDALSSHNTVANSPSLWVETGASLDVTGLIDGRLDLANGQILKGGGTVIGSLGVSPGASVAPGASPGILHTETVVFSGGSTFAVEITGNAAGTGYDQLHVTGTVELGGATLALSGAYLPASGETFVIIQNEGGSPVGNTFSGRPEGATIPFNAVNLRISYQGGDGNDVTLTASPPPTAATLAYFRATAIGPGQVSLGWSMLVEVQTLGFLLERAGGEGRWERVTPGLIPAVGSDLRPPAYTVMDNSPVLAAAYRLLAVDLRGGNKVLAVTRVTGGATTQIERTPDGLRLSLRGSPRATLVIETTTDVALGRWVEAGAVGLDHAGHGVLSLRGDAAEPVRLYRSSERY